LLIYNAVEKNLPLRALGERYASSKILLVIFEVEDKELLVVAGLLSVTINRSKGDREHCASPRGYKNIRGKRLSVPINTFLVFSIICGKAKFDTQI
jgi:hypothetical protein